MDMPVMTLPRQIKRLICKISLRRVSGGRLGLDDPLIVLENMCLINVSRALINVCRAEL